MEMLLYERDCHCHVWMNINTGIAANTHEHNPPLWKRTLLFVYFFFQYTPPCVFIYISFVRYLARESGEFSLAVRLRVVYLWVIRGKIFENFPLCRTAVHCRRRPTGKTLGNFIFLIVVILISKLSVPRAPLCPAEHKGCSFYQTNYSIIFVIGMYVC